MPAAREERERLLSPVSPGSDDSGRKTSPYAAIREENFQAARERRKAKNKKPSKALCGAIIFCFLFMVAEGVGGIISHSLAVLTDAAHMLTDVAALSLALFSMQMSQRPASGNFSYGWHRAEAVGALGSVFTIWALVGAILVSAVERVVEYVQCAQDGGRTGCEVVESTIMFGIGCGGLLANFCIAGILSWGGHHGHSHSGGHGHSHGGDDHGHEDHDDDDDDEHGGCGGHGHAHHGGSSNGNQGSYGATSTNSGNLSELLTWVGSPPAGSVNGDDHGHAHDDHGHSHDDHGHAHDEHDHAHDDHGHSHDNHGHSHNDCGHDYHGLHDHGHSHDDHGNSHDDHGHSHGGGDCNHEEDHHGHSHGGKEKNLNMRGAFLHALGDCIQSVGVIIAATVIWIYNSKIYGTPSNAHSWANLADPFCSILFGIITLYTTVYLFRDLMTILMEATPREMKHQDVVDALSNVPGVDSVHDLHIWSLTAETVILSVHLVADLANTDSQTVLGLAQEVCKKFHIEHTTIQIDGLDVNVKRCSTKKFQCAN